jgi:hypothetical protein
MQLDRKEKCRLRAEAKRRSAGVKPKKKFDERFDDKCTSIPLTGCIIWLGHVGHAGHGQIFYKGKLERTHRVAWEKRYGQIPDGMSVLHKCDIPCCVNPDHLFIGTQRENISDMIAKGRGAIGEKHHLAKLTKNKVSEIIKDTRGVTFIAMDYGVTASTISAIKSGRTWKQMQR